MADGTYHHPDLRTALIEAGVEMTREGGPDALGIREVTRRVGVSPNAAYRHFADRPALLRAVSAAIQERVAERMRAARTHGRRPPRPEDRLRAVGLGYIDFALDEPGWFAVVFFGAGAEEVRPGAHPDRVPPPYAALVAALDAMAEAGALTAEQRAAAEWPCWAAVHGFAELALRGPLQGQDRALIRPLAERTVDAIIAGLRVPR